MKEGLLDRLRGHRAYPYVVGALVVVVLGVLVVQCRGLASDYAYGSPGTNDYIEYWTAGQLLKAGDNPYDFPKLHQKQLELDLPHKFPIIMWNPPWLLVWMYPLLWLPFMESALVWLLVNAGLLILSATLIWRTLQGSKGQRPVGIAWAACMLFVPALMTLRMGQTSSIILLGVAGFYFFACRGRCAAAGACLALVTIKPHVVYLLGLAVVWWVVTERRWRLVAGAAATMLPTLAVLTLLWPGWWSGYRAAMAEPPLYWKTATMGGILRQFVFTEWPQAQFLPPILGSVGLFGYLLLRRPTLDWKAMTGPLLLLAVPTAAYGWAFDQTVMMLPYLTVVAWLVEPGALTSRQKAVVGTGLVLIGAGMVALNLREIPELYFFWPPWALGAVYLYAWAVRRDPVPGEPAGGAGAAPPPAEARAEAALPC